MPKVRDPATKSRCFHLRTVRGMTIFEFSIKANVSTGTIALVEHYHYVPLSPEIRARMAAVLETTEHDLFPTVQIQRDLC